VTAVATAQRVEPFRLKTAAPLRRTSAYPPRHGTPGARAWSLRRMFYLPRHLRLR
jgi:hypothetical protein